MFRYNEINMKCFGLVFIMLQSQGVIICIAFRQMNKKKWKEKKRIKRIKNTNCKEKGEHNRQGERKVLEGIKRKTGGRMSQRNWMQFVKLFRNTNRRYLFLDNNLLTRARNIEYHTKKNNFV